MEERFKATTAETPSYLLASYRYIDLNPARAGRVQHPGEYRWFSYRRNRLQLRDGLIEAHREYQGLGSDDKALCANDRMLFGRSLSEKELISLHA